MEFDPNTFTLTIVLTTAGATIGAALITGVIGVLKKVPVIGPWIDADREPLASFVGSAILVVAAYASTLKFFGGEADPAIDTGIAALLAFFAIAQIAMGVHDTVTSATSKSD